MAYMLCPHCGQELKHIKVQTETETLTLAELLARLKALEELVEDTAFREMIHQMASEEGRRMIEENERLKADPEFVVPESLHKKCMEILGG